MHPLNAVEWLVARNTHDCERKVRATQSIALLNGKLGVTSGFKVTENNRRKARVKRWGKSPPGATATWRAAPPASCKVKYIGI